MGTVYGLVVVFKIERLERLQKRATRSVTRQPRSVDAMEILHWDSLEAKRRFTNFKTC